MIAPRRLAMPVLPALFVSVLTIGFGSGCGEEEPWDDAAAFAPPVEAAPPTGTWDHGEPTSAEEIARRIAEEMKALEAAGYLADEASPSESGTFTGTAPPPVAFGAPE